MHYTMPQQKIQTDNSLQVGLLGESLLPYSAFFQRSLLSSCVYVSVKKLLDSVKRTIKQSELCYYFQT